MLQACQKNSDEPFKIYYLLRERVYIENTINKTEILQYALENNIIDFTYVQEQIEMKKREEILKQHTHKVWEGKDGYWHSYLHDETKSKGRKPIKKKQLKDLEDVIIAYYNEHKVDDSKIVNENRNLTLKDVYPEWLQYKSLHTKASSYIKRITSDWKKFYMNDPIIDVPIRSFTKQSLDMWAHRMVKDLDLTKKQYMNMSHIIRDCLNYAESAGYIEENMFLKIHINPKLFRKVKKKDPSTQVYTEDEQTKILEEAWKDFQKDLNDTTPLAVMLAFFIGTRPGETVAIKESDICGNYLNIQRMESGVFETKDGIVYSRVSVEVVEYTKSEAGERQIIVPTYGMRVIEIAKEINRYNHTNGGYLFNKNGKPIKETAVSWRLQKYCNHLGIKYRSPHKIRKTYISALIDDGVNIDTVRRLAGHEDEKTTYGSYCYDRRSNKQVEEQLENALCVKGLEILENNVVA